MPKPTSKDTSPWQALDNIMANEAEPMGPEWFTIYEFCERYKLTHQTSRKRIDDMVKVGILDKWTGVVSSLGKKACKYRMKPRP